MLKQQMIIIIIIINVQTFMVFVSVKKLRSCVMAPNTFTSSINWLVDTFLQ